MVIILNASELQRCHDSIIDLALGEDNEVQSVLDETIPIKLRQQTYDHENGCLWLSTCVLVYLVDTKTADNIIEI